MAARRERALDPEAIRDFCLEQLAAAGFEMTVAGPRPEDGILGIAGSLTGRRARDHFGIHVHIRSRESFLNPARLVQLRWLQRPEALRGEQRQGKAAWPDNILPPARN